MEKDPYPKIYSAQTDAFLPETIPSGYSKYKDFKMIAKGGTSLIQSCVDTILGRKIACKTLLPQFQDVKVERKRFLREARVSAQLQHPNTPTVYEIGRDNNDRPYFTMKLITGQTLKEVIQCLKFGYKDTESDFPLNRLVNILVQVGYALGFAHNHGVVHRDIKPSNIQIGSFGEVLVMDWGIAKVGGMPLDFDENEAVVIEENQDAELTVRGVRLGTPLYMSPEQVLRDPIDERTDIYNLGSILYEMMTLKKLYSHSKPHELLIKVKKEDPTLPSLRTPDRDIPKDLERICMKAIKRNRDERYQTMMEMVEDLLKFQD